MHGITPWKISKFSEDLRFPLNSCINWHSSVVWMEVLVLFSWSLFFRALNSLNKSILICQHRRAYNIAQHYCETAISTIPPLASADRRVGSIFLQRRSCFMLWFAIFWCFDFRFCGKKCKSERVKKTHIFRYFSKISFFQLYFVVFLTRSF